MVAYEFKDGKGTSKDLATGITETFTYEISEDGFVTFRYEDRTSVKKFAARCYPGTEPGDPAYYSTLLTEAGSPKISLNRENEKTFAECPIYSYPETAELFELYYVDKYGKKPKQVELDGSSLNVTEENGEIHYYALNFYGSVYDYENYEDILLGTGFGDINHDNDINAADASEILMEAAVLGSGAEGTFVYAQKQAADINGDGTINAGDAADILTYAAAIGSGNTEIQITDFKNKTK